MEYMCEWAGIPIEQVQIDAPNSLNTGFPDAGVLKSILLGVEDSAVPLQTLYRYLLDASLLEQSVSYEEYLEMINSEEMQTVLENVKKGGMVDNLGANMFESKVRQEMKTGNELKDNASSKTEIEEA
jgi:hypothetical protein